MEVSGKSMLVAMDAMLKLCDDSPRVKGFPFGEVTKEGKAQLLLLSTMAKNAALWRPPMKWDDVYHGLVELMEKNTSVVARVTRYYKSLIPVWNTCKSENKSAKRSWQNGRNAKSKRLRDSSIPQAPAKVAADCVCADILDPTSVGLQSKFAPSEFAIDASTTTSPYDKVVVISPANSLEKEAVTFLHEQCDSFFEKAKAEVDDGLEKVKKSVYFTGAPKLRRKIAFTTIDRPASTPSLIDTTVETRKDWIGERIYEKIIVYGQEPCSFDNSRSAYPFRGMRQLLTMFRGNIVCITVPVQELGGQDAAVWVKGLPSGALDKFPAFVLEEGASCLVPAGLLLLTVAMPGDEAAPADEKKPPRAVKQTLALNSLDLLVCYTIQLFFDKDSDSSKPADVCKYMSSEFVNSINDLPKSIHSSEAIKTWRTHLAAERVAQARPTDDM